MIATDPAAGAEARLRSRVESFWATAEALGLAPGASPDRLSFTADLTTAAADADFAQENTPEIPAVKVELFSRLDAAAPVDSLIASSSPGITMSTIQSGCGYPELTVNLLWHLGNGPEGIQGFMAKFMDPLAASWKALGNPEVTPSLKQAIVDGVLAEAAGRSIEELSADRDSMLVALQRLRAGHGHGAAAGAPSAAPA